MGYSFLVGIAVSVVLIVSVVRCMLPGRWRRNGQLPVASSQVQTRNGEATSGGALVMRLRRKVFNPVAARLSWLWQCFLSERRWYKSILLFVFTVVTLFDQNGLPFRVVQVMPATCDDVSQQACSLAHVVGISSFFYDTRWDNMYVDGLLTFYNAPVSQPNGQRSSDADAEPRAFLGIYDGPTWEVIRRNRTVALSMCNGETHTDDLDFSSLARFDLNTSSNAVPVRKPLVGVSTKSRYADVHAAIVVCNDTIVVDGTPIFNSTLQYVRKLTSHGHERYELAANMAFAREVTGSALLLAGLLVLWTFQSEEPIRVVLLKSKKRVFMSKYYNACEWLCGLHLGAIWVILTLIWRQLESFQHGWGSSEFAFEVMWLACLVLDGLVVAMPMSRTRDPISTIWKGSFIMLYAVQGITFILLIAAYHGSRDINDSWLAVVLIATRFLAALWVAQLIWKNRRWKTSAATAPGDARSTDEHIIEFRGWLRWCSLAWLLITAVSWTLYHIAHKVPNKKWAFLDFGLVTGIPIYFMIGISWFIRMKMYGLRDECIKSLPNPTGHVSDPQAEPLLP